MSGVSPEMQAYIEASEARLGALLTDDDISGAARLEPSEPPPPINVIAIN